MISSSFSQSKIFVISLRWGKGISEFLFVSSSTWPTFSYLSSSVRPLIHKSAFCSILNTADDFVSNSPFYCRRCHQHSDTWRKENKWTRISSVSYIDAREYEVRERIPHPWLLSNDNIFNFNFSTGSRGWLVPLGAKGTRASFMPWGRCKK